MDEIISKKAKDLCKKTNQKFSNYIQTLIKRDLSGENPTPTAESENPLTELYGSLMPLYKETVEKWCKDNSINQKLLLSKVLGAIGEYAESGYSHKEMIICHESEIMKMARNQFIGHHRENLAVAEDAEDYGKPSLEEQWKAAQEKAGVVKKSSKVSK